MMFNTMLGNVLRMMCRRNLEIMLDDNVQHYVEDDLEDEFEHCARDHDQDECVDYLGHFL